MGQVYTCRRFTFGFYVLIFIVRIIIFSSNNVIFHVQSIRRVRSTAACSRWTAVIPSSGSAPAGKLPDGSFVIFPCRPERRCCHRWQVAFGFFSHSSRVIPSVVEESHKQKRAIIQSKYLQHNMECLRTI